jgi:hypothetical protein
MKKENAFHLPSTLAFFSAFTQNCLENLEGLVLVAEDIDTRLLKMHCYVKEYEKSIHDMAQFLNTKPDYPIEFQVKPDANGEFLDTLV